MSAQEHLPGPFVRKNDWGLSEAAFRKLLDWLDEGVDSGGQKYLEMRRRLAAYFERHDCDSPDDLADQTLNRVSRRIEEEGEIRTTAPARYCYITAKFVLLEQARARDITPVSLEALPATRLSRALGCAGGIKTDDIAIGERRLQTLEFCLERLPAEDRELIVQYYQGKQRQKIENRRRMAERLGSSMNALSVRACRIRSRLESCVRRRMGMNPAEAT